MRKPGEVSAFLVALFLAGCHAGNPGQAVTSTRPAGQGEAGTARATTPNALAAAATVAVSGVALAPIAAAGAANVETTGNTRILHGKPVTLISQDGGSLISQDGGSLISQDGGSIISQDGAGVSGTGTASSHSFRRLAADDDLTELPLAGAGVLARDAATLAVLADVKPGQTDGRGRFTLAGLPADRTVLIEVVFLGKDGQGIHVAALAHPANGTERTLEVSESTTVVAAKLAGAADPARSPEKLDQPALQAMASAVDDELATNARAKRDMATSLHLARDAAGHPKLPPTYQPADLADLRTQANAIVQASAQVSAAFAAKVAGDDPRAGATTSPAPSPAPTRPGGDPSAAPSTAAPSPAATSLPSPAASSAASPQAPTPTPQAPTPTPTPQPTATPTPSGTVLATYPVGNAPADVEVDANDYVWVSNFGENTVYKLSSSGTVMARYTVDSQPNGIVFADDGRVWVCPTGKAAVDVIDTAGSVTSYSLPGAPTHAVFDRAGNLWAAMPDTDSVQELSASGNRVASVACGLGAQPFDITLDVNGNLWVSNAGNGTVSKIVAGKLAGTFTVGGSPTMITTDAGGRVWVANGGTSSVIELANDGSRIGSYAVSAGADDLVFDALGNLWVTSMHGSALSPAGLSAKTVTKLSSTGAVLATFQAGQGANQIVRDGRGRLWVTNSGDSTLTVLAP